VVGRCSSSRWSEGAMQCDVKSGRTTEAMSVTRCDRSLSVTQAVESAPKKVPGTCSVYGLVPQRAEDLPVHGDLARIGDGQVAGDQFDADLVTVVDPEVLDLADLAIGLHRNDPERHRWLGARFSEVSELTLHHVRASDPRPQH